jgi:LysR family glycine cleavage system transcriptional activator
VLRRYGPIRRGEPLDAFPLLHASDEPWSAWSESASGDRLAASAATIDDSVGILAAAEEGLGYALARWSLVVRALQRGQLKLAGADYLPYEFSYYFVCPKPYLELPKVTGFRDWLREAVRHFPTPADFARRAGQRGRTSRARATDSRKS